MDAIIFFYKKRNLTRPLLTITEEKGYRLIRVGINGGESSWFGRPIPMPPEAVGGREAAGERKNAGRRSAAGEGKTLGKGDNTEQVGGTLRKENLWKKLFFFCRARMRRREETQERKRQQERYEKAARVLEEEAGELVEAILSKTEALDDCGCVYMDGVRPLLTGEGLVAGVWKKRWVMPEFADYRAYKWVAFLLPYAAHADFVLLGTASCIPETVKACARSMKSLRWILREEDYDEEAQDFIEDFYEEYGLAIMVQTVTGRNGFRSLCLEAARPVCVFDFTDEVKFFWGGLVSGSVWLDFASLEEKQRRLERMAPGIAYFSMKKLWSEVKSEISP